MYAQVCADAGVEPLPDDEAREQATALMAALLPAFEVDVPGALSCARPAPVTHARTRGRALIRLRCAVARHSSPLGGVGTCHCSERINRSARVG